MNVYSQFPQLARQLNVSAFEISIGHSGRIDSPEGNGENKPFLGRWYWGFWVPRLHHNGGHIRQGQILDCGVQWLIFWFGMTIFPMRRSAA